MRVKYMSNEWRKKILQCKTYQERDQLTGLPINLAAKVLGITRSRVHQLVKEDKLDRVRIVDEVTGSQIGLLITYTSINRRRKLKRQPGQWQPTGYT